MKLQTFKDLVINKTVPNNFFIFKCKDKNSTFVPYQYLNQISKDKKLPVTYIDTYVSAANDMFTVKGNAIEVLIVDTIDFQIDIDDTFLYVICNSVDKKLEKYYDDKIIEVPALSKTQIQDYVYSTCEGVSETNLNLLVDHIPDLFRLDIELQKITLFNTSYRSVLFEQFLNDNVFSIYDKYSIYDFTNALLKKDVTKALTIYKDKNYCDIGPLGVVTILRKNLLNIINIQLHPSPTAESCGLSDKQFWAIKNHSCGIFTKNQLIYLYKEVLDIDYKLKTGNIPAEHILDFIIIKVLSV